MTRRASLAAGLLGLGLAACTSDGGAGATAGKPPGPPDTTTSTTSTTSTTGTETDGASSTTTGQTGCMDCAGFCVAPVEAGQTERPSDDAFFCRDACIPAGAVNLWCDDASVCCDPQATCDTGLCISPEAPTTSIGSTSDGTDTSGGTDPTSSSSTDGSTSGMSTGDETSSTGSTGSTGAAG